MQLHSLLLLNDNKEIKTQLSKIEIKYLSIILLLVRSIICKSGTHLKKVQLLFLLIVVLISNLSCMLFLSFCLYAAPCSHSLESVTECIQSMIIKTFLKLFNAF